MLWTALIVVVSVGNDAGIDLGDLLGMLGGGGGGGGGKQICPPGQVAVPGDDQFTHTHLYANGCGPTGMQMDEPYGLYKCCNGHDICYGLCGTTHKHCESVFKKCMAGVCKVQNADIQANCTQTASGFSSMTAGFGKGFHHKSQVNACTCIKKGEEFHKHYVDLLTKFYEENDPDNKPDLEKMLAKYKGKEGRMLFKLAKKYGVEKKFVRFDNIHSEL